MSVPRGNGQNGGHFYSNLTQPMEIDIQFTVDSTNSNGLGIKSLKSNGYVVNVFMNTSATPATGNPDPLAGYVVVEFQNNYNHFINLSSMIVLPTTGSDLAVTSARTAGQAYVITVVGTTTLAEWQGFGLPPGLTPTVGQSFIALTTGTGGSHTGKVRLPGISLINSAQVIGTPDTMIANSSVAANGGAQLNIQLLAATNSSTTTPVATAPADGSVVSMKFLFDASSVTIDGL